MGLMSVGVSKKIKFPVIRVKTVSTDGGLAIIKLEYYDENGNLSDSIEKEHPTSGSLATFHFATVQYSSTRWTVLPVSGYAIFEGNISENTATFQSSVPYSGKTWTYSTSVDFALGNIDWSQYGSPKVVLK